MYPHHEASIENLVRLYQDDPEVLAIFLGGSVAKGKARPDSDVDAMIIVAPAKYEQLAAANRLTECVFGHCTYEKGYFDIKYSTKAYLAAAAEKGSEPARNAFLGARCLIAKDEEIVALAQRIPVYQVDEKADKMLSFFSTFALYSHYFWGCSQNNPYLRHRAAVEMVLYGLRLVLAENEVLFPCQRGLMEAVKGLPLDTAPLQGACERLLQALTDEAKADFVAQLMAVLRYQPPKDFSQILTRFTEDNEIWWYKDRPNIAEW